MNSKDTFYRDRERCKSPSTHIIEGATESPLKEIDGLYGTADVLSMQNAKRHRLILWALSFAGTLLTLAFLLYDEAELHGLIVACGAMILCLFCIRFMADRLGCHRKYLEYRVLAECLRCQFFLSFAGMKTRVLDLLPWSVREGIPWIPEVLSSVSDCSAAENGSILDPWIVNQKEYHKKALANTVTKNRRNSSAAKAVFAVTVAAYVAALLHEFIVYGNAAGTEHADLIRAILKTVLGTMSAVTLFTGSFYGKMSLPNVIDDHKRMISLYETAEKEIAKRGESEELLVFLAREFLNENSTWYAYQSKNGPDIAI